MRPARSWAVEYGQAKPAPSDVKYAPALLLRQRPWAEIAESLSSINVNNLYGWELGFSYRSDVPWGNQSIGNACCRHRRWARVRSGMTPSCAPLGVPSCWTVGSRQRICSWFFSTWRTFRIKIIHTLNITKSTEINREMRLPHLRVSEDSYLLSMAGVNLGANVSKRASGLVPRRKRGSARGYLWTRELQKSKKLLSI